MAREMLCSYTTPIIMQQFPNKSSVLAHSQLPNKATDVFDPFFIPCYFQTKLGWKRKTLGREGMLN